MTARTGTAVAIAFAALAAGALFTSGVRIVRDPEDLRAFYCAGAAVAARADPYKVEPLRSCEVRERLTEGLAGYDRLAVPAPLPGYALVPFALASHASFDKICALYVLLLAAAIATTVVLVADLSGFSSAGVAAALVLSDGALSLANGQILPFALLALCASAWELSRGRPVRASAYAACATIEPHVAFPALVALALAVPKTRVPLALCAAFLGALSLLALGVATNLEYIAQVVPEHARSETNAVVQYSLTTLLVRAGADPNVATVLGDVSYVAACALGIAVGVRGARVWNAPALIVLVPPAFALLGGPFVHLTQIAVAVPALLVAMRYLPQSRAPLAIALILVALPWQDLVESPLAVVAAGTVLVTLAIVVRIWKPPLRIAALAVVAFVALGTGEKLLHDRLVPRHPDATVAIAAADRAGDLAESTWTAFASVAEDEDARLYLATHAPTWCGVILMVAVASGGVLAVRTNALSS